MQVRIVKSRYSVSTLNINLILLGNSFREKAEFEKKSEGAEQSKSSKKESKKELLKNFYEKHVAMKFSKARSLIQEMKEVGIQPNRVTYNELVN